MWDQGCHLFEGEARVMTDPHILSTAELTAKRAGHSGAGRQRTGVGASLRKPGQYEPFDKLRVNGINRKAWYEPFDKLRVSGARGGKITSPILLK